MKRAKFVILGSIVTLFLTLGLIISSGMANDKDAHTSSKFEGVKANTGYVTHTKENGKNILILSDDFIVPETPDPHWQIVDSKGNVYLLEKLKIKDDKYNKSIILPSYIKDVAKVQIWCAWAEALLGEASFQKAVM